MFQMLTRAGAWLVANRLSKVFTALLVWVVFLTTFGAGMMERSGAIAPTLIAYNVDLEMDKARIEKTVEHYGEPIRDIVEKAAQNNENAPDRKPTAENSYARESPLNEALPESIGRKFSQSDLQDMEKNMDR